MENFILAALIINCIFNVIILYLFATATEFKLKIESEELDD